MNTITQPALPTGIFEDQRNELTVRTDTTLHTRLGWWLVIAGCSGMLVWASLAPLEKGVPLSGTVTVETNKKSVQHAIGGTVDAILVKEGDRVQAGDVLLRMNPVQASAEAEMVRVQYVTARATEARLLAEVNGSKTIAFPPELLQMPESAQVDSITRLQQRLFMTRLAARQSELAALEESIQGLAQLNDGLENAQTSRQQQMAFSKEQLESLRALTVGGFVSRNRLLDAEQSHSQIHAALAEEIGNIGRGKRQIAELRLRHEQTQQDHQKEVRTQLSDVQKETGALAHRLAGLDHILASSQVRAPVDGTVIGMAVFAPGAVIAPGFKILDVVPSGDALVVEGRLPVHLIDRMTPNLPVELIFSAFNQNLTPKIPGAVTQVSADRLVDDKTGEPYYRLLAKATPEGMKQIAHLKVRAGMPVEVFVKTGERTLLNYLLKPLLDHFRMALIED
jgi:protease secretion system membrane fusion protein